LAGAIEDVGWDAHIGYIRCSMTVSYAIPLVMKEGHEYKERAEGHSNTMANQTSYNRDDAVIAGF